MSFGGSASQSSSSGRSFVDRNQQPFLQDLREQGQALANQQAAPLAEQAFGLQGSLGAQGNQLGQSLAGQASGQNPFVGGLQQLGNAQNPFLDQQIAGLGGDLQRFLGQSLGQIGQGFASANQFGGSRQGLAEGSAITGAINEFGQQSANLRGDDLTRQAQALQAGGQLQQGAALGGLSQLQGRFNLGTSAFGAQFQPLLAQQQLVGDPTVLNRSTSSSQSASLGFT